MDVNKENQVETKKRSVWVLTYRRYDAGEIQDELTLKVYMDKPTIMDLAQYFDENSDELRHGYVAGALLFLDHLVNGYERAGAGDGWYVLKEVTES